MYFPEEKNKIGLHGCVSSSSFTLVSVYYYERWACLKVSGYEVIGRARGDLRTKFAANV